MSQTKRSRMNLHHVTYMHVKNVQIAGQDFIVLEDVQPMHIMRQDLSKVYIKKVVNYSVND